MRSAWIKTALALIAGLVAAGVAAAEGRIRMLVQSSPLAGSQYHRLPAVVDRLREGDELLLVREPGNRFDHNAVRVVWRGEPLGYLPRRENRTVAAALDRGEAVRASIERLRASPDPWQRLRISVFVEF